ncbi:NnrU family protein [Halomonas beimenensis]|uniref:NnrU family protein, required for expression of nitric oxide and nitrite reductases (Nir and Nor) n=1 Tax=Halomonas beimenensis TaxID=475662 RepID=A0A291PA01_9GAMM|nr:NnrU family protein [Halomonas beimenensis]ATJ83672.1 NnrU family protein, required for expression of nitric oxide and nitrite reductases (Nir and Nor) [Halomonas beimenensis]
MTVMILGLVIFLGVHSVRIVADDWRSARIAQWGELRWKALYGLASLIGLALAIWGFGQMRLSPVQLWVPPVALRHLVALLMIPAFILVVAAYVPHNHLKARLGHPMILGVKLWAFSHLLANGRLGDVVFFGAFLVWAILDFRAARRRPAPAPAAPTLGGTLATLVIGVIAYGVFAFWLHAPLIGVPVM